MKFIGDRLLRKEDPRLVQGRGRYVGDIALPGMLHAAILRSPHAHARLGAIDAARALKAAGVVGVVTFADLGDAARQLPIVPPHAALRGKNFSLLAGDRARFVGEAVAVVAAESRDAAEDARELIDVAWEPLPSVQDPTAPGPACVHDEIPDNLAGRVTLARGDVTAALAAAPRRASLTLRIGRGGGQPMETRGLVAEYNAMAGLLTVWASSQVPHQVRQFICDLLGLEPHRVRVLAPDVGGGFGAKLIVYPEDVLIPLPGAAPGPSGAVARGSCRAHADGHAGAHAGAHGRDRLRRRGATARAARPFRPRHGRLHAARSGRAAPERLDAGGSVPDPHGRGDVRQRLHPSRAGDAVPRRRPAAGRVRHRAGDGPHRPRDRAAIAPPFASPISCNRPTCRTTSACRTIAAPAT